MNLDPAERAAAAGSVEGPAGIQGSSLSGPWPVGRYAAGLRDRLREMARVQVFGEVFGLKAGRAKVWFELRDGDGALPCSMWRRDFDALRVGPVVDGTQVVVAGGCDLYVGSRTSSPSFSFQVSDLRVAGEGDLLAQLEALRRQLDAEGLFLPQKALSRPELPRTIGVVTGEQGKARDDVLAGLDRRGWAGRLVWAFTPVQDRHAAPRITRALQELAALGEVDVIVVARGGGSLADLFAFCDETLCRTVAMLRVPVISSVGHHTDRTLIDDVAAVACSTPTHAAEVAAPVNVPDARRRLDGLGGRLHGQADRAVRSRAQHLVGLARAPAEHVERQRARLRGAVREIEGHAGRVVELEGRRLTGDTDGLLRKATAARGSAGRAAERLAWLSASLDRGGDGAVARRRADLARTLGLLDAHDPQRTLERGYALVEGEDGEPLTSVAQSADRDRLVLRMHDGRLAVRPSGAAGAAEDVGADPTDVSGADRGGSGNPHRARRRAAPTAKPDAPEAARLFDPARPPTDVASTP